MARTTMGSLITRVRLLVSDPAGASQVFADDQIQDALDAHRTDVRYLELEAVETLSPTGTQYLAHHDPVYGGGWEDDEVLQSGSWATLTPATSDRLVGRWTFAVSTSPPVYVTGKVYDIYAAAADVLDAWAAKEKLSFDAQADDARMSRSQKHEMLLEQARTFRRRSRPRSARLIRSDQVAC